MGVAAATSNRDEIPRTCVVNGGGGNSRVGYSASAATWQQLARKPMTKRLNARADGGNLKHAKTNVWDSQERIIFFDRVSCTSYFFLSFILRQVFLEPLSAFAVFGAKVTRSTFIFFWKLLKFPSWPFVAFSETLVVEIRCYG
jgi:hypothetical protein